MTENLTEKIAQEKRRRNQIYITFDYMFNMSSYYDFFSRDALYLANKAKKLAFYWDEEFVTSSIFFATLFEKNCACAPFLNKYFFKKEGLNPLFEGIKKKNRFWIRIKQFFHYVRQIRSPKFEKIVFSKQMERFFAKAAKKAQFRYRTPVLTPEIFMITLMDTRWLKARNCIKDATVNRTNWYLLRYELLKEIHFQESAIRGEVPLNQQFFAYLLQIHLPKRQFKRLIEEELLSEAVSKFRNILVSKILKQDILQAMWVDTQKSIWSDFLLNERMKKLE
jgi:hypothetical protein